MKKVKSILLVSAILCFAFSTYSQDVKSVLVKLNKVYAAAGTIRTQLAYRFYDSPSAAAFILEQKAEYTSSGNYSLLKTGGTERMINGSYNIYVDHQNQVVGIMELVKESGETKSPDYNDLVFQPDSALKYCEKYTYKKINASTEQCTFYFDEEEEYTQIEYYINAATGYLQKIVVHANGEDEEGESLAGCRVEIVVLKNEINPKLPADLFSESRFFTVVNNAYKLVPALKNYSLLSSNP